VAVDSGPAAAPPRFGVAGDPVGHSRSPAIHNAAYAALGIEADYQLLPLPVPLFAQTVRALPDSGFRGINVTIPHKRAARELADSASDAAAAIGAANTLTFADGEVRADNTDAPGMIAALEADPRGSTALVLGAGGTARAALWALTAAGAKTLVWNRTAERARLLAEEFGARAAATPADAADAAIVVNTTAVGMDAAATAHSVCESLRLDLAALPAETVIVDFVYRDGGSPLTVAARERGLRVVDGEELLVRQAGLSFEIWFGRPAPLDAMRAALR
jgi:shikimate dehydrogenase